MSFPENRDKIPSQRSFCQTLQAHSGLSSEEFTTFLNTLTSYLSTAEFSFLNTLHDTSNKVSCKTWDETAALLVSNVSHLLPDATSRDASPRTAAEPVRYLIEDTIIWMALGHRSDKRKQKRKSCIRRGNEADLSVHLGSSIPTVRAVE